MLAFDGLLGWHNPVLWPGRAEELYHLVLKAPTCLLVNHRDAVIYSYPCEHCCLAVVLLRTTSEFALVPSERDKFLQLVKFHRLDPRLADYCPEGWVFRYP